jgi:hypothetical protein
MRYRSVVIFYRFFVIAQLYINKRSVFVRGGIVAVIFYRPRKIRSSVCVIAQIFMNKRAVNVSGGKFGI